MEVTYEVFQQKMETDLTRTSHMIAFYPEETVFLSSRYIIHWKNQPTNHDSDTTDMIRNDPYTSCDTCDLDDDVFNDKPIYEEKIDTSLMFDNKL